MSSIAYIQLIGEQNVQILAYFRQKGHKQFL